MPTRLFRAYLASFRGFPRPVWLIALAVLVNQSGAMGIAFATLYMTQRLGTGVTEAGQAFAAYAVGGLVGAPLAGRMCDRFGWRRVLVASLAACGALLMLMPLAASVWHFAALLALYCLAESGFRPAYQLGLTAYLPEAEFGRGYSLTLVAMNLGATLAGALGGLLAGWWFEAVFWADGATALAASAVVALLLPRGDGMARTPRPAGGADRGRGPWLDPAFLLLFAVVLGVATVHLQQRVLMPIYLTEGYGLSAAQYGMLLSWGAALFMALTLPASTWLKGAPQAAVAGLGSLVVCLGYAILPFGAGFAFAGLAVTLTMLGAVAAFPAMMNTLKSLAPPGRTGSYLGNYQMAWWLAFLVAPPLSTWSYARFGGTATWLACAAVGAAALAGFAALGRRWGGPRQAADSAPV
ncbi:MAG TPA: MFS transporter [Alphaproteobacteria bacterium]|nr:MFS transporter [Alphaproteobacteria bacterium]